MLVLVLGYALVSISTENYDYSQYNLVVVYRLSSIQASRCSTTLDRTRQAFFLPTHKSDVI